MFAKAAQLSAYQDQLTDVTWQLYRPFYKHPPTKWDTAKFDLRGTVLVVAECLSSTAQAPVRRCTRVTSRFIQEVVFGGWPWTASAVAHARSPHSGDGAWARRACQRSFCRGRPANGLASRLRTADIIVLINTKTLGEDDKLKVLFIHVNPRQSEKNNWKTTSISSHCVIFVEDPQHQTVLNGYKVVHY